MTIYNMRQKKPAYNLISNNCQNFALFFLDAIKVGTKREFGTAFAVWQRATGRGLIMDLFLDHPEDEPQQDTDEKPASDGQGTVQLAQHVMEENTTKLDNHHDHC